MRFDRVRGKVFSNRRLMLPGMCTGDILSNHMPRLQVLLIDAPYLSQEAEMRAPVEVAARLTTAFSWPVCTQGRTGDERRR